MTILNRYKVIVDTVNDPGAVNNVNPDVITGATGNSDASDAVHFIKKNSVYIDQVSSKLVEIHIDNLTPVLDNNYIAVDLKLLGISGIRPVLAAQLLGVYDPNSTEQVAAGATPSFIGIWDRDVYELIVLSIVNSMLVLKIPVRNYNLFFEKVVMINLIYKQEVNYF